MNLYPHALTLTMLLIFVIGLLGQAAFRKSGDARDLFLVAANIGILGLLCSFSWGLMSSVWAHLP